MSELSKGCNKIKLSAYLTVGNFYSGHTKLEKCNDLSKIHGSAIATLRRSKYYAEQGGNLARKALF